MTIVLVVLALFSCAHPTPTPVDRSADAAWVRGLVESARAGREDLLTWSNPDDGHGKARNRRERITRQLTGLLGTPTDRDGTLVWRAKTTLTMSIQTLSWGEIIELEVQ